MPVAASIPEQQVLYIKHIVCPRGIRMVRRELELLGLQVLDVRLGAAIINLPPGGLDWPQIRVALATAGFSLLQNPTRDFAGCLHAKVFELLRRQPAPRHRAFVGVLAHELGLAPGRLYTAFASLKIGRLANWLVAQRLNYAKELLQNSTTDISRIARQLGYGGLAHFSGQFRRTFQCSPSGYRQQFNVQDKQQLTFHQNDASTTP